MSLSRLVAFAALSIGLGACGRPLPPSPPQNPQPEGHEAESDPSPGPAAPEGWGQIDDCAAHDLGMADNNVAPLIVPPDKEVASNLSGPAFLFGRPLAGKRANMPGRHGELLVAIDSPYQIFGKSQSYLHVAAWRKDGSPAAGAAVYVGRKAVGVTDATGTLVFAHLPEQNEDGYTPQEAVFVIDGQARCGAVGFSPYGRTPTFALDRLFVYTDRGVFRPGETVHTRVIGWRLENDYAPLAAADVEMVLRDGGGHSIAAGTGKTDAFGVTALDLQIPLSVPAGDYELGVAYGTERASTTLQIRHFEPPSMRVEHTLPRFLTRGDGDALPFSVTLVPPFQRALGAVELRVQGEVEGAVAFERKLTLQGTGPHALGLAADEVKQLAKGSHAAVTLRFVDGDGQRVELRRELAVWDNPYTGLLELDRDQYTTGDRVEVVARLTDRSGVPARHQTAKVKLKQQQKTLQATSDASGMARFSFTMTGQSEELELLIDDVLVATNTATWDLPRAMLSELDRPVVKEREQTNVVVRFPAGHVPAESQIHMDMVDTSGAIVTSQLLPVTKDAQGFVARGSFTAPSWGSMLLTFFALGKEAKRNELGLLVAGQSLVVQTDRELQVTLSGLPDTARPGAALDVRAEVRDATGKPVEVEVGAALVDRSTLSLKDPLEITPMDRFYDPQMRTLATTGAAILTWPVVSRNWGGHQHDVALPSFPYLDPGDPNGCMQHWDEADLLAAKGTQWEGGMGIGGIGEGIGLGSVGTIGYGAGSHRTMITIRTKFPATSIWEPHLRGEGSVAIRGTLPDKLGEQELLVVASDKRGGVGMVRRALTVQQPVFVQADVPSPFVAGEQIDIPVVVFNQTAKAADFDVTLSGAGSAGSHQLHVTSGGSAGLQLPLTLAQPGEQPIGVRAVGAGHDDRVERDVVVVPAGVPLERSQSAALEPHRSLTLPIAVTAQDTGAAASLRIELPAVTSALAQLDVLERTISDDPWSLTADLESAALVLQLADRHQLKSPRLAEVRAQLLAALSMVQRVQRPSGGFGYWRNGEESSFVTARVLAGLIEARRAGLPVPDAPVANAAAFLAGRIDDSGLADIRAIGWWEGDQQAVREGITAEIFHVLARLEPAERKPIDATLGRLRQRYEGYLAGGSLQPLTAGHALSALLRLGHIEHAQAKRLANELVALRDGQHWEPSWFHAYAGRVDTTLAVLEALHLADPSGSQAAKRDALRWILATREGWGSWHGEAATGAALRALTLVGAAPKEIAATITVQLDGNVVKTVTVDPADPWLSTQALAQLDLGPLSPGKHSVTIDYDGKLEPAVTLVSRHWRQGSARQAGAGANLQLRADGPAGLGVGKQALLRVEASGAQIAGSTLRIAPSNLIDVDLGALGQRTGRGHAIARVLKHPHGGIDLIVAPTAQTVQLDVPLVGARRGRGALPSVALIGRSSGAQAHELIVSPGAVTVQ